jgi:hypothetical protein
MRLAQGDDLVVGISRVARVMSKSRRSPSGGQMSDSASKTTDSAVALVADRSNLLNAHARRVTKRPVNVTFVRQPDRSPCRLPLATCLLVPFDPHDQARQTYSHVRI